ncbi:MAG: MBL fold metallo-hydrolase [Clostridia bacterium]|nr:MBL fold metallo-hydrolase [Clostridia bacterium]
MRVTCLAENTACSDAFGCEHGLSLYIETSGARILFDMGQTTLFAENAGRLGIDLAAVDFAVLSHGHNDHGGGLGHFLALNASAPVYLHPDAFTPHFGRTGRDIGLDPALRDHPRLHFLERETVIAPGIGLYGAALLPETVPVDSAGQTVLRGGARLPEDYCHEQYLLIEEAGRWVLFSGCSHRGIENIVACFSPDVLVGGFHFSHRPLDDALSAAAARLASGGTVYYTCHCTGDAQFAWMRTQMPHLHRLSGGQCVEI